MDLADRDAPLVTFRALAPIRWETLEVAGLDGVGSLDELERHVQVAWRAARDADPGRNGTEWMIRVALMGPCPLWSELRTEEDREVLGRELREILGGLDVVVLAEGVVPDVPVEEHRERTDVLGETLRLVDTVRRGETRLEVDVASLAGITVDDPAAVDAYVRSLLGGAEAELVSRMLGGRTAR